MGVSGALINSSSLLMMIVMMPVAGTSFFGAQFGIIAPVMTLGLHVIYGVILRGVYGLERLDSTSELPATRQN